MSDPQRLYNIGAIDIDECCRRLSLIRMIPVQDCSPMFVKIAGAVGGESALLQKIGEFPLPSERIGEANIRIRTARGGFSVSYINRAVKRQFAYPGRFENKTAAMSGVKYLVYAINNEIDARKKQSLGG